MEQTIMMLRLCKEHLLKLPTYYVFTLGLFGVGLSLFDIVKILKSSSILPRGLFSWREDLTLHGKVKLSLTLLAFALIYYFLLLVGVLTGNPYFLVPFIFVYGCVLTIESMIFFMQICTTRKLSLMRINNLGLATFILLFTNFVTVTWMYNSFRV